MELIKHPKQQRLNNPVKWAGGKRWLAPLIQAFWRKCQAKRLVEPFCGGLSVGVTLRPKHAWLADINPHLINLYRWIKKGLTIDFALNNNELVFYQHRERFNELIRVQQHDTAEAAGLFYYLNRTGYNGLCRFNSDGHFNVPFGKHQKINYLTNFDAYRPFMQDWQFSCSDFTRANIQSRDLLYLDPPYDVEFTRYSQQDFTWDDQVRLIEWLAPINVPVLLSNEATQRIIELYQAYDFELFYLNGPRAISCKADRKSAREVLAVKGFDFDVSKFLQQVECYRKLKWG